MIFGYVTEEKMQDKLNKTVHSTAITTYPPKHLNFVFDFQKHKIDG